MSLKSGFYCQLDLKTFYMDFNGLWGWRPLQWQTRAVQLQAEFRVCGLGLWPKVITSPALSVMQRFTI